MSLEPNAFPSSINPTKRNNTLRWILSFSFFLALFAVISLLVSYGIISLSGAGKPTAAASPATPVASSPAPTVPAPATQAGEAPALPSGAAGHSAGMQAQPTSQR